MKSTSAPGPGQYHPSDPNSVSSKYGFGTAQRKGAPLRGDIPGPGAYNLAELVGSDGPKSSFASRRELNRGPASPGPGAYQPADTSTSLVSQPPQWGFGCAPRDNMKSTSAPGPGQ